ncbi:hypothetical protein ACO22_07109 [Paracoccidioides brasiliensis]|uniref:Uncharacterized protein n=1 Tax=Paracoccidioides brasiliensis TaxID=121759 RepID=A0A1D2J5Z6_PARBR|nr:hypothetical protein ACO22_07109 [Paracoccidioides brasiliensis]
MRKGDVELGSPGREKTKKDNTINTGLEAFFSHLSDAVATRLFSGEMFQEDIRHRYQACGRIRVRGNSPNENKKRSCKINFKDTRYEAAKSDPARLRRHTSVPGKGKPRGTLKVGFIPADAKLKIAASTHHGNEAYQKANLNAVV